MSGPTSASEARHRIRRSLGAVAVAVTLGMVLLPAVASAATSAGGTGAQASGRTTTTTASATSTTTGSTSTGAAATAPSATTSLPGVDMATLDRVTALGPDRWLVPFRATEVGSALRLSGETDETVVNLPVIDGTTPDSIVALLTASPDVDTGYLEYQGNGVPARLVDFAALGGRPSETPITLDLRGMQPVNGQLKLTLRSRLRSQDPSCVTSLLGAWVELRQGGVLLTGQETPPAAVSTYLPKLLQRLEIQLPSTASPAEASAALRIAQAAQRKAIGHDPEVVVVPMPDPTTVVDAPYRSGVRQVAVSNRLPAGAHLVHTGAGGVVLAVGGQDDAELDRTSKLLASSDASLAAGSSVTVERFDPTGAEGVVPSGLPAPDPTLPGSTTTTQPKSDVRNTVFTLDQLSLGTERVTGLGRLELPIAASQTTLGGPVRSVKIHLEGTLTPIPDGADATLSLLVNNQLVTSRNLHGFTGDERADGTTTPGRFALDAKIADDSVKRALDVRVLVDYSPPGGECRPGDVPFMIQLDPKLSTLTVDPGQSLPAGFERFPQTLAPTGFDIGVDEYTPERLALAFRLVLSLQRTTSQALDGSFTSLDQAVAAGRPAVLVSQWTPALLKSAALLSGDPMSHTDDQRVERLRMDVDQPRALLEAFTWDNQDRLLLTWSDGTAGTAAGIAQADALVTSIGTRTTDYGSLYGDTYLVSPGTPPLSVSLRGQQIQATPSADKPNYLARAKPLLIAAVVLALIVLAMSWLLRRRRRKAAATGGPVDDDRHPGDDAPLPAEADARGPGSDAEDATTPKP
ncbi:MAG: hypothetical protein U0Q07_20515 [Acidimicrobiales bacterium]